MNKRFDLLNLTASNPLACLFIYGKIWGARRVGTISVHVIAVTLMRD